MAPCELVVTGVVGLMVSLMRPFLPRAGFSLDHRPLLAAHETSKKIALVIIKGVCLGIIKIAYLD